MPSSKKKSQSKAAAVKKPAPKAKAQAAKVQPAKAPPKKGPQPKPSPSKETAPAPPAARAAAGKGGPGEPGREDKPAPKPKKSSRKERATQRRGPGGELIPVGEILLPSGPQGAEEIQYLFRGIVAAERPAADVAVNEVQAKRPEGTADLDSARADLHRQYESMVQRFDSGSVEPLLPARQQQPRRTFQTVQDRARLRRREIGAFLRGLDIGQTEPSHLDSHGEDSLETLMKWAARLEKLLEADEPDQADYNQYHRFLDQLENTTEALIVDVEATLRRLRDRVQAR
jgi:hypothetical protein